MSTPVSYRFGDFRLVVATREAWRGAAALTLPPKAFDCVVHLIGHRDRAVGRDELISAVWGRVDVSDNVLGQTILLARRAFDDTGREQQVIRTVQRFGYHWVAPVAVALEPEVAAAPVGGLPPATQTQAQSDGPTSGAAAPARDARLRPALLVFALAIALGGLLWTLAAHRSTRPARVTPAHADVALVLPVVVDSSDAPAWIRLGVMDLLADRLRTAGQTVVPSNNVVALAQNLKNSPDAADLEKLSATTGAALILGAHAKQQGNQWRVSLRTLAGRIPPVVVEGSSVDVLSAARDAAARMAAELGHAEIGTHPLAHDRQALDALLREADAAILATRLDVAERLLAHADPAQRALPEVQYRLGKIDYRAGRLDAAQRRFEALLAKLPAETDPVLRAGVLNGLGAVLGERLDYAAAERRFDQAVQLLDNGSAPDVLGKSLNDRATARGALGRHDAALADFAQARIVLEGAGDSLALAAVDLNSGVLDMQRDHLAEAAPVLQRAAERFALFDIPAAELQARISAAEVALALLEPATALTMNARLEELATSATDPTRRRAARYTIATILAANGQMQAAQALLSWLHDDAAQASDTQMLDGANALAARLAFAAGQNDAAARAADAALKTLSDTENARLYADTWLILLRAERASGQGARVSKGMNAFSVWAERNGTVTARIHLALAQAEQADASGAADAARSAFERALKSADANRVPIDLLHVARTYVDWLIRSGDLRRASAVAGRVAAWIGQDYEAALVPLALYHGMGRTEAWRAALARARELAGERAIPSALLMQPSSLR